VPPLSYAMRMEISEDEVLHVAELARIKVTLAESREIKEQLETIFQHFSSLQDIDTEAVDPTMHISGNQIVLDHIDREDVNQNIRSDLIETPLDTEQVLQNSPRRENTFIRTKGVL